MERLTPKLDLNSTSLRLDPRCRVSRGGVSGRSLVGARVAGTLAALPLKMIRNLQLWYRW